MEELFNQTRGIYVNEQAQGQEFTKQIAFNVIPHCDVFMEEGETREEWKMAVETRKILDPDIRVTATCVRVPVFVGHGEAVNAEFERPITVEAARVALSEMAGVSVVDPPRRRGLCDARRMRGRGPGLCQPHPQGPDGRALG